MDSKNKGKPWKLEKQDGPDPGSYNDDKGKDYTKNKPPGYGFGKGKREFFTNAAAKKA